MSCSNNQKEKKELEKKEKLTFFSSPLHEYLKLIFLVFVAVHLSNISNFYPQINALAGNSESFCIFLIFCFCYINSNYKLEFSFICTIIIMVIFFILKKQNFPNVTIIK